VNKTREANFELLRIVGMCAIIGMHFLDKGGLMKSTFDGELNSFDLMVRLLEAFLVSGVNIYVMCGAYYLIDKEFSLKRILRIWGITLFYSVLIMLVHTIVGMGIGNGLVIDKYLWITCLTPVISEHYWFVTAYVLLLFVGPVLNRGIKEMPQKSLLKLILVLTVILSVCPSLCPLLLPTDKFGMDLLWFILLYLYGAYIRLYGIRITKEKRGSIACYIIASVLIFFSFLTVVTIYQKTGKLGDYITRQYHYNSVLCLMASLGLFGLFEQVRIPVGKMSGAICEIAGVSFGVYLIHEHIVLRYMWPQVLGISKLYGSMSAFAAFVLVVPGIYIVCGLIEWIRKKVYSLIS